MNTSFIVVFKQFLRKITDYHIFDLSDDDVQTFCYGLMLSAIPKIRNLDHDLEDRDEIAYQFNSALTETEIEIIAIQMVYEWIEPQVNNTLLTKQFIGTKEEKFFAQSNQIDKLLALQKREQSRAKKLRRDYAYRNNEYLNR